MPKATDLLRRYGLEAKRSLGQNFLVDEHHLGRIAAAADLTPGDTVLEVGPGLGVLTGRLAAAAGCVVAVELDRRLVPLLQEELAAAPHVRLIHGDILRLDPVDLLAAAGVLDSTAVFSPAITVPHYKVVANLPYYITSAVLRHLLEADVRPSVMVLLVQREVAERICAEPGELSILAVSVQFYARPTLIGRVPAGAFYPQPKVESAILRLDVAPAPVVAGIDAEHFFTIVRAGFGQKRKQLINSLSAGLARPKEEISAALQHAGIDPQRRPQTLSLAEWEALGRALIDL